MLFFPFTMKYFKKSVNVLIKKGEGMKQQKGVIQAALFGFLLTAGSLVFAEDAPVPTSTVSADKAEIKADRQELKADRQELKKDIAARKDLHEQMKAARAAGDKEKMRDLRKQRREMRRDMHNDNKERRSDRRDLRHDRRDARHDKREHAEDNK